MKYIIFISFLFIFCCTKNKSNDNNLEKETIIRHNTEQSEFVLGELNSEELDASIDKNINDESIAKYLSDFFPDGNYQLLEYPLNVNYRKIIFAVHSINFVSDINDICHIYDTVVGFEITDGVFKRYLLIKNFQFINNDDTILIDFSKGYDRIYGFNISYSYPRADGYTPGLVINTYFDNGNRVADSFTISWNENDKKFEKTIFSKP
jgi:hypothetical protein